MLKTVMTRQINRMACVFLVAAIALFARTTPAANARNAYVSVSCDAVSTIQASGCNFYVICPNDVAGQLGIYVRALRPYRLVAPNAAPTLISVGGVCSYRVSDENGTEDFFSGSIYVLKVEIDPVETNVCWKASRCTLSLTADSAPGGNVRWRSRPSGISGTGRSVAFSPQSLAPGEYAVSATSDFSPSCTDLCVVRIVSSTFTIFVDQPGTGGDRDPFELVNDEIDVGHAFWKYEVSYPEHVLEQEVSFFANKTMGYYPATSVKPLSPSAAGCLVIPDISHMDTYEVEKTWQISLDNLMRGLDYARNLHSNPGRYDLNNNNCTDAAIAAGAAVGVVVPATRGTWPLGGGSNPGDLGEDLRGLTE